MLGKKQEEGLNDQFAIISIIATAIRDSGINNPADAGTVGDGTFEGNEETIPFAKAVVAALEGAGYEIVPKEKDSAPRP